MTELKRRNVFKVGMAYVITAWLLAQVAEFLLEVAAAPDWVLRAVVIVLIIGFPVALIFAWAFELTPEGIKPEKQVDRSKSVTQITSRKLDFVIIAALALAVVIFAVDKFVLAPEMIPSVEPTPETSPAAAQPSVAVLPFVNMSPDPEQEYFSDGIAEELLNQLAKIRGLQVAGRTSSFAFKGQNQDLRVIGEKLNVANILEGSVRKAGDRVRITVQLINAANGYHLWSETYDRNLTDIFAIQEETAKSVAAALSITLGVGDGNLGVGGTRNFAAYDAYLSALSLAQDSLSPKVIQAIEQLEKAVTLDPEYADAWSALAGTYETAANFIIADRTDELMAKSEAAALRAVEIAPGAVTALRAAAQLYTRERDWIQAERSLKKAIGLAPTDYSTNMYYAFFLESVGRPGEAMRHFQQAARTEPLILLPVMNLTRIHQTIGDTDGAYREYERAQGLAGNQAMMTAIGLVLAMETGDRAKTEEQLDKLILDDPAPRSAWPLSTTMRSLLDSPDEALVELHRFYNDPAFDLPLVRNAIGIWASYFGDEEFALEILRELFEAREFVIYALWQPIHKNMRRLPEFKDLVRDVGLVDYWRSTGNWGEFCAPVGHADFECQ